MDSRPPRDEDRPEYDDRVLKWMAFVVVAFLIGTLVVGMFLALDAMMYPQG